MQFEKLKSALIGEWQGTNKLYLTPPPQPPLASPSKLSVASVAGDSFLQFNYTWIYEDTEQSGILLLGCDEENAASAAWIDSFHMSSKIISCAGALAEGAVNLSGSYAAPPGPDWGWRIAIRVTAETEFQIVMHNVSPEGEEELAVQIDYTRSA